MTDIPSIAAHTPDDILAVWFDELKPSDRFNGGEDVDRKITARFSTLVEGLDAAGYPHIWENTPHSALALIIALDQFPRNMYRGQAGAFLRDSLALDVAMRLIGNGFDAELTEAQKQFAYLPLMHSEELAVQDESVRLFATVSDDTHAHAQAHREEIERFGRFPARNDALGRKSTEAEQDYLDGGGYGQALRAAKEQLAG